MVWREPKNHHNDCYFCMVDMSEWSQRKKKDWYYSDIESARRLIPHCDELPVLVFISSLDLNADEALLEAMDVTDRSEIKISSYSRLTSKPTLLSKVN